MNDERRSHSSRAVERSGHILYRPVLAGLHHQYIRIDLRQAQVIGDAIYDLVARNRYRWFGRRDACILPNSDRSWPP
jgi:predicted DCC family thiol-disulfide oxidoreductase YuxK